MAYESTPQGAARTGRASERASNQSRVGGAINLVVVGYDASDEAAVALRWAAELAGSTSSRLRVVWAWEMTDVWAEGLAAHHGLHVPPVTELEGIAHRRLAGLVADLIGEHVYDIDIYPAHGVNAATRLLGAAGDADILVVGSRGRGRVSSAIVGSVSGRCIREATCPVLVIPHPMVALPEEPVDPRTVHGHVLARYTELRR